MNERVKVYHKNKPSEEVKIVYACDDPKKDDEVIFKLHGYFYSCFRNSNSFYVNDKRLVEGGKNWIAVHKLKNQGECLRPDFDYMTLPCGHSSFEDFVEKDDDIEYIWKKPKDMDAVKKNEESRKPDLIDVWRSIRMSCEGPEKKNDPTHPSHYAQGGISVWDVIKAYTDGLNGVDAFNAGNAIKYILRWHHKNGVEDLEKAKVYIDELIKSQKEKEK